MPNAWPCGFLPTLILPALSALLGPPKPCIHLVRQGCAPDAVHEEGQEADGARQALSQVLGDRRGAQLHPAVRICLPKHKHRHQRRTCRAGTKSSLHP